MELKLTSEEAAGTAPRLQSLGLLNRPPWIPALQSAFNLSLLAALGCLATMFPWWPAKVAVWPVMGLVLAGFLNAAHDCAHGTFANSKIGNRVGGILWSTPLLINFTLFKYAHLTHHRFTRMP